MSWIKMRRILQIFSALFLVACDDGSQEPTETTTRGEVNVVIDESFRQLFDNQIYTFESIYPNAKINAEFLPENQALSKLLNFLHKIFFSSNSVFLSKTKDKSLACKTFHSL